MSTQIKEEKLKPLLPTLRQKKRFLLLQIESEKPLDFDTFSKGFTQETLFFMGSLDYGKAGVWILKDKFDEKKQEAVIKVALPFKDKLLGSIALIQELEKIPVRLKIKKVSGTLKGVYSK